MLPLPSASFAKLYRDVINFLRCYCDKETKKTVFYLGIPNNSENTKGVLC